MKHILIAAVTTTLLATSANATSLLFSLPNLTFAPAVEAPATQDCLSFDANSGACMTQE